MEHGLEYIMFYDQNHMTPFDSLFWSPTGSQQATRSACICETRLLRCTWTKLQLSIFNIPEYLDNFCTNLFVCAFQSMYSSNVSPREFNCYTFSLVMP